jgi:hypothetical protein
MRKEAEGRKLHDEKIFDFKSSSPIEVISCRRI